MSTLSLFIVLSPVFTFSLALWIFKKQNSSKAWTGGPISRPKSHWLAWTVFNWFFVPLFFLFHPDLPSDLKPFFIFHLASWWVRGPLELVMIYKWLNWTPYYGMAHDAFHFLVCAYLLTKGDLITPMGLASYAFCLLILATTVFELSFAALFKWTRSREEEEQNIYFASDDPKWIFINRVTLACVTISYVWGLTISAILISPLFS